ncbi:unnamed protein product [Phytophthora fragariaefolia]|uniref:Unnamed protein product n=1 Tax=Phytophthora fragariaefolia TaxID=1490495 RepID=A0A9W7CVF4_9STRA|nr:unnamed protein product [Phytophthora fragariaefolia]
MESRSLLAGSRDNQSARFRFPEPVDEDDEVYAGDEAPETKGARRRKWPVMVLTLAELSALPWFGWLFVYAFVLFCFSVARCLTLRDLVVMYGTPQDYTSGFKITALGLGVLEDFVCASYFAGAFGCLIPLDQ